MRKRNFGVITKKAMALQEKAEELIIGTMTDLNIGLISLVKNGDGAEFDVWKPFCVQDNNWDNPEYLEIIVIANVDNRVCIIPNAIGLNSDIFDVLEEYELFPMEEMKEGSDLMKLVGNELMLVDATLTPTETFIDLCNTISELRELVEEPIKERTKLTRD